MLAGGHSKLEKLLLFFGINYTDSFLFIINHIRDHSETRVVRSVFLGIMEIGESDGEFGIDFEGVCWIWKFYQNYFLAFIILFCS